MCERNQTDWNKLFPVFHTESVWWLQDDIMMKLYSTHFMNFSRIKNFITSVFDTNDQQDCLLSDDLICQRTSQTFIWLQLLITAVLLLVASHPGIKTRTTHPNQLLLWAFNTVCIWWTASSFLGHFSNPGWVSWKRTWTSNTTFWQVPLHFLTLVEKSTSLVWCISTKITGLSPEKTKYETKFRDRLPVKKNVQRAFFKKKTKKQKHYRIKRYRQEQVHTSLWTFMNFIQLFPSLITNMLSKLRRLWLFAQ